MSIFKLIVVCALILIASTGLASSNDSNQTKPITRLAIQSGVIMGLMASSMVFLWSTPSDFSQWYDKPQVSPKGLHNRWQQNVSAGPVWDNDIRLFNAYAHIHVGAAYSAMCLQDGFTAIFCNFYSNLMSMAWEYGPEALIEIPSWQDILMTGFVGARIGEQFHHWKKSIAANNGRVFGSRTLGWLLTFLMDPVSQMTPWIEPSATRLSISPCPQDRCTPSIQIAVSF